MSDTDQECSDKPQRYRSTDRDSELKERSERDHTTQVPPSVSFVHQNVSDCLDCETNGSGLVAQLSLKSLIVFKRLWRPTGIVESRGYGPESSYRAILNRFVLWTDTVVEMGDDRAIRVSENVFQRMLDFVLGIAKAIIFWACTFSKDFGDMSATKAAVQELQTEVERSEYLLNRESVVLSENDYESFNINEVDQKDLRDEICNDINTYIQCLVEFIPIVERLATSEDLESTFKVSEATSSGSKEARAFALLIKYRFPQASKDIVERLAEVCFRRSVMLSKMASGTDREIAQQVPDVTLKANQSKPLSWFFRCGNAIVDLSNPARGMIVSKLPKPLPDQPNDHYVTCYICKDTLPSSPSTFQWRSHVRNDIKPYVCTYPGCPEPFTMYGSSKEWQEHESQHRSSITTSNQQNSYKETPNQPGQRNEEPSSSIQAMKNLDRSGDILAAEKRCPLCLGRIKLGWLYQHLLLHLEILGVACLPRELPLFNGDDDDIGSMSSTSIKLEVGIVLNADEEVGEDLQNTVYAEPIQKIEDSLDCSKNDSPEFKTAVMNASRTRKILASEYSKRTEADSGPSLHQQGSASEPHSQETAPRKFNALPPNINDIRYTVQGGCLSCQKGKAKCNLDYPSCSQCRRFNEECVYMSRSPCITCEKNKIKCSKEYPSCSQCFKNSSTCRYMRSQISKGASISDKIQQESLKPAKDGQSSESTDITPKPSTQNAYDLEWAFKTGQGEPVDLSKIVKDELE